MHRNDIQGLRAIAVSSVIIFHAIPWLVPGGYIGVDVFFVLSGYLITLSIKNNIENKEFSIKEFYIRRVRRLMPALVVMLISVLAAGYFFLSPMQYKELGRTAISTVLFLSSIDFLRLTGYFDGAAETKPLLHTWSLSVEEQFYLLFPVAFYWIWRKAQRFVMPFLALSAIASLAISEFLLRTHPTSAAAYFLAPSRAFELLIGAMVATSSLRIKNSRTGNAMVFFGLILMIVPMFGYSATTSFPGVMALIPCIGTAMVLAAGIEKQQGMTALLASGPMIFVGAISYSAYLWHWPILAFIRNATGLEISVPMACIAIGATLAIAYASYRFVEQPFLKPGAAHLPYLPMAGATGLAISAIAAMIFIQHGMPGRFDADIQNIFATKEDFNKSRPSCHGESTRPFNYQDSCVYGDKKVVPDTVIWGDSHGVEVMIPLGDIAKTANRSLRQVTSSACPPSIEFSPRDRPKCGQNNEAVFQKVLTDKSIKNVVLLTNATRYPDLDALMTGYEKVLRGLKSSGKTIYLVQPIPVMNVDPPSFVGMSKALGFSTVNLGISRHSYDESNALWRSFVSTVATKYSATVIDPASDYCDEILCHMQNSARGVLYFDMEHLGVVGAQSLAAHIGSVIY